MSYKKRKEKKMKKKKKKTNRLDSSTGKQVYTGAMQLRSVPHIALAYSFQKESTARGKLFQNDRRIHRKKKDGVEELLRTKMDFFLFD